VVDTRAAALARLGIGHAADALAAADAHVAGDPLLRLLRERLANGRTPTLAAAARALSVSARSLQRRLGAVGTSFVKEVCRARVEHAMRLLVTTDDKLAVVAAQVGCASLASFSAMFAREVGVPPSVWRAQHGAAR
jgi:AraC-like DNA-binding protein